MNYPTAPTNTKSSINVKKRVGFSILTRYPEIHHCQINPETKIDSPITQNPSRR